MPRPSLRELAFSAFLLYARRDNDSMLTPLSEKYVLTECYDKRYAARSFEMREEILARIAGTEQECWYICDETEAEFYDFFTAPPMIALGVLDGETLAAVGVGSYREVELERFRPYLPEGAIEAKKAAYVELIQVDFEYRGQGLQRVLFEELERRYRAAGVEYLTGIVSPHNFPSRNNFLKEGYEEYGSFIHQRTGFERLIMIKKL